MVRVSPLSGDYCPDCAMTLIKFPVEKYSIIPTCKPCISEFFRVKDDRKVTDLFKERANTVKIDRE